MNIKEVARQTKLTDKTIRYYESIGLIQVARKENGYRVYNDDHINTLHVIRMMRYLGISVEHIQKSLNDPETWNAVIESARNTFENQKKEDERKALLFEVLYQESKEDIFEISGQILDEIQDEELLDFIDSIKSVSLFSTIMSTFALSGSILWLLVSTYTDTAIVNNTILVPIALVCTVTLTSVWIDYFKNRNPNIKHSNTGISLLLIVLSLILSIGVFASISIIQQKLFTTDESIMYVENIVFLRYVLLVIVVLQAMITIFGIWYTRKQDVDFKQFNESLMYLKKYWAVLLAFNLIFFYIFTTNITVVNQDGSMVRFTPLNLKGTQVKATEITNMSVGFNHGFLNKYQSEFQMVIITDSFSINIGEASFLDSDSDTYVELEMLDILYTSMGVDKTIGNTNVKNCMIDAHYCDRFMRIINNTMD